MTWSENYQQQKNKNSHYDTAYTTEGTITPSM